MRRVLWLMSAIVLVFSMTAAGAPKAEKPSWQDELPPKTEVADFLQEISLNVKSGSSEGSGIVVTRELKDDDEKPVTVCFVWTAAHVVDDLRTVETVVETRSGTDRKRVRFKDAQIVTELLQDGRRVGELKMDAQIVCFGEDVDLALLRIRKTNFIEKSAVFYLDEEILPVGTDLYHVGSMAGQKLGANSMTSGILSAVGRVFDGQEMDQTEVTAVPGSSGGGVFTRNGACIGLITRGVNYGDSFNYLVPVRSMRKWANKMGVGFAIDSSIDSPTEAELKKIPIEDPGADFGGDDNASLVELPYLIRRVQETRVILPHPLDTKESQ